MTRHRTDIKDYPLTGGVDTGIDYSLEFLGMEAAVAAGLDLEMWVNNIYPHTLKARTIAWYNTRRRIEAHTEDAKAAAMDKSTRNN